MNSIPLLRLKSSLASLAAIFLLGTFVTHASVAVSNLVVAQRPGTKLVDISYDVSSTAASAVTVTLSVYNGSTAVSAPSVSGAVGDGVATGTGKTMVWNMGADWTASVAALAFSVKADDKIVPAGGDPTAVSWEVVNDRWVKNTYANGDITMKDRTNNKMWLYAYSCGRKNWLDAKSYCDNLTYAGYTDWILPDINTLASQYSQKGFFAVGPMDGYWSSTSYSGSCAWSVDMLWGTRFNSIEKTYNFNVWPVRG